MARRLAAPGNQAELDTATELAGVADDAGCSAAVLSDPKRRRRAAVE